MGLSHERILKAARFIGATGQQTLALALLDLIKDDALKSQVDTLRGKILAQMGRYPEAISLWEKVLARAPQDPEITNAIRKAKQMQEASVGVPSSRMRITALSTAIVCLLLLFAACFGFGRWTVSRHQKQEQAILEELKPSLGHLVESTISKEFQSHSDREREHVTVVVSNLQRQVQTLAQQQTVDITNQIGGAKDSILSGSVETRERIQALSLRVAESTTLTDLVGVAQRVQSDVRDTRELLNRWGGSVSNELRSVQAQQDQLAGQQAAHQHAVSNLSLVIETVRRETRALDEKMATQQLRSDQLLRTTVGLLRPGNMDRLARQIAGAEEALSHLKSDEARYRADNKQVLVSRHRSILKQLRDTEKQLKDLQDQWNLQVVPWLRAQNALSPHDE